VLLEKSQSRPAAAPAQSKKEGKMSTQRAGTQAKNIVQKSGMLAAHLSHGCPAAAKKSRQVSLCKYQRHQNRC